MTALFQQLPSVDKFLKTPEGEMLLTEFGHSAVVRELRQLLSEGREFIKQHQHLPHFFADHLSTLHHLQHRLSQQNHVQIKSVHNLTGTVLHTNLGRALWAESAQQAALHAMKGNVALEYDLEEGKRSHRDNYISELLAQLTGAEAACIVNNNAAAVILCLNEFANGKNTIVSRGELVEIGGSFRIPEIMKLAGTALKEVGTTNKTHIFDYENNIDEGTAVLLKVHTSNFKITGFTEGTDKKDIAELGKKHGLLTMEDLGSGVLVDFSKYGLSKEPTIQESIESGMDIVTVSGDKLLGGPQCGIILGKKPLIERLKKNQYLRAFRVNKITISILENIFQYYKDEREAVKEIPVLNMITEKKEKVLERAEKLSFMLTEKNIENNVIETEAKIGGGSMPEETVESYAVCFNGDAVLLEKKFRGNDIPVIGRIKSDRFIIDAKTLKEKDFEEILGAAERIFL